MTAVEAERATAGSGGLRVGPRTVFFGVLLVLLAAYLQLAMGMEWRTAAGRIGPGFFPRVIGALGVALALVALVQSLRAPEAAAPDTDPDTGADGEEAGEAELGRHPRTMAVVVGASAVFAAAFVTLGAVLACALFLFGCLWLLNRPRPVLNTLVSVGLALGLYLLFETLLGAGLPAGVLPLP
ncbi:tripartite tricarboxylate transporter TctB family protein [Pseudonocardia kunmingensis]|uniref:Tripartite tricarboxylate transporter TctB family protein n=1 Tax=Pseudonocardia kunmingensis TaxID=630975 RepID=A0A543DX72_9PSEU|nr:tripartite tricarboxylate transporter TctB family protein [Pseudonocardia kunmingensis]TQM13932.1 tripartite tricarboxylate transporter TctB family protein [Pseudonocardia kunmingensis]